LWGTATSSHQVEGNNRNNQWWTWEQQPGRIYEGHASGLACNWWAPDCAEADFDRAQALHQNAHRLSLEWSRLEPVEGLFDSSAYARYRQMLQGLRARGIEPMVTLHHFTDPLWLSEQGGWSSPHAVARFRRFVERTMHELGDLVRFWCTINEPNVYALIGYIVGFFPPGHHNPRQAYAVLRNLLLGHAAAYRTIHRLDGRARVGLVVNVRPFVPAPPASRLDRAAAATFDRMFNGAVLNALENGVLTPPLGYGRQVGQLVDSFDFIGLNYYTRELIRFDIRRPGELFGHRFFHPDGETSDLTKYDVPYGENYPSGLIDALQRVTHYGKPIYVTECGLPDDDDDQRPRFLITHLAALHDALQLGIPVQGFFHWTLVDNFEWAEGWKLRFGLFELDPASQVRTPRRSADTYAAICQANALTPEIVRRYAPEVMHDVFG
jgi:beta-glucosidase